MLPPRRVTPRLLGRVAPPAPLTWRRSQPAAPGRTEPRRGEPTAPDRTRPRRAEPLRIAAHRAVPSPARPQLPEPRGAGAGPVPERSRGCRLAGGTKLSKVPLGPAPSRQEIPPRPGLIGKARRVVRRGRAGAAVTHRDAASSGAGAGPPIPPHRHRSAPGRTAPGSRASARFERGPAGRTARPGTGAGGRDRWEVPHSRSRTEPVVRGRLRWESSILLNPAPSRWSGTGTVRDRPRA